ncbi:MAG: pyruvate kinase [Woeseiaceae bacterium]|nr:pyruvate kinase [Woeseiaceae bacterium]
MFRRTKIVATLGPATDDKKVLKDMMTAGLDVVRINFSHGHADDHRMRAQMVREAASEVGREIGMMGDLQGPKIRVCRFEDSCVMLDEGESFFLDSTFDREGGNHEGVGVALDTLHQDVEKGDMLLLNDGLIVLQVDSVEGTRIHTTVVSGGKLSDNKGINKKGGGLSAPALTEVDKENIKLAAELNMDFLAVSFVRTGEDVEEARRLFREAGGEGHIVAKVERTEAVENIDSIIEASDVIMVARGDLGVEMGYTELTGIQKRLIRQARKSSRIVITATQMMESMIEHKIPTRAEVSDVSNAVMDGTDAVMLSGETAVGKHPVQAIEAMAQVCQGAEKFQLTKRQTTHRLGENFEYVDEAIAMAVMYTANHLDVSAIIALTESGSTAKWMSRIRSDIPIFALTPHEETRRRVTMYRGVYPVAFPLVSTEKVWQLYRDIFDAMLEKDLVSIGDLVIFTKGDMHGISGGTNAMKILKVTSSE